MLKIGDFSKLSMISVRMLRHYDENGLLVPVEVDRFSGYRYYYEEQLGLAMRITALRDIGFGVSAIREIIERSDDTHYIETMYIARREELYREYSRAAAKLSAVRFLFSTSSRMASTPCFFMKESGSSPSGITATNGSSSA